MAIICPFHRDELDEIVEAQIVSTYDDENFNSAGVVEMSVFRCLGDPVHQWEHPSRKFWMRFSAWGTEWKKRRDMYE